MFIGDYRIAGFELGNLRPFGSPSMANLIEIPIAAAFGGIMAVVMLIYKLNQKNGSQKMSKIFIPFTYGAVVLLYILFPGLPE